MADPLLLLIGTAWGEQVSCSRPPLGCQGPGVSGELFQACQPAQQRPLDAHDQAAHALVDLGVGHRLFLQGDGVRDSQLAQEHRHDHRAVARTGNTDLAQAPMRAGLHPSGCLNPRGIHLQRPASSAAIASVCSCPPPKHLPTFTKKLGGCGTPPWFIMFGQ